MAIKAIIWDLGGVLVRTEDWAPREMLASELNLGREELEKEMFANEGGKKGQLGLISGEAHWQNIAEHFGMESEQLVVRFFEGDRLDEELITYIGELKANYKVGLLSNAYSTLRALLENDWKILKLFDSVIISAEVGIMKPDAQIYQLALDGLGAQAEETIFVDDFEENIEAAQALGMKGVRFRSREQAIEAIGQLLAEK